MDAKADVALTASDVKLAMEANDAWPFPGSEDGWVQAHNAIRLDMTNFSEAVNACTEQLKQGQALKPWVIPNLQKWWLTFADNVHHHHEMEEIVIVPQLAKLKLKMPEKMSSDHPALLKTMEDVGMMVKGLKPSGPSVAEHLEAFTALSTNFEAMRSSMAEHLQEEEDIGLPLMRKTITYEQFKPIEKMIIAKAGPALVGWVLRPMKDDAARRKWMTEIARIPGPVQSLIMMPAARKFRNDVARLVLEVKAGEKMPPESGCLCF